MKANAPFKGLPTENLRHSSGRISLKIDLGEAYFKVLRDRLRRQSVN